MHINHARKPLPLALCICSTQPYIVLAIIYIKLGSAQCTSDTHTITHVYVSKHNVCYNHITRITLCLSGAPKAATKRVMIYYRSLYTFKQQNKLSLNWGRWNTTKEYILFALGILCDFLLNITDYIYPFKGCDRRRSYLGTVISVPKAILMFSLSRDYILLKKTMFYTKTKS